MARPRLIVGAILALVALGPGAQEADDAPTAAVFSAFLQQRGVDEAALSAEHRQLLLDELGDQWRLAQEAVAQGLHDTPAVTAQLALQRQLVLAQARLQQLRAQWQTAAPTEPSATTTEWRIRHILVPQERTARRLLQQLQRGGDFAALARQHSQDASAAAGGELGWLSHDALGAPLAQAVANRHGLMDKPLKTAFGWHVVEVLESRTVPVTAAMQFQQQLDAHLKTLRDRQPLAISPP